MYSAIVILHVQVICVQWYCCTAAGSFEEAMAMSPCFGFYSTTHAKQVHERTVCQRHMGYLVVSDHQPVSGDMLWKWQLVPNLHNSKVGHSTVIPTMPSPPHCTQGTQTEQLKKKNKTQILQQGFSCHKAKYWRHKMVKFTVNQNFQLTGAKKSTNQGSLLSTTLSGKSDGPRTCTGFCMLSLANAAMSCAVWRPGKSKNTTWSMQMVFTSRKWTTLSYYVQVSCLIC